VFCDMSLSRVLACVIVLSACSITIAQTGDESKTLQLQLREEFSFDLPKLYVSVDDETKEFNGVKITFPGDENRVFIGTYDDMEIKNSSQGNEKVLYRELPEKAGFLSKFETKNIIRVNKYFISSLEILDNLLQKKSWGRCLYFDAYYPRFLNGYYSLIGAARNSECALPFGARIPEEEFDVSLNSPKTDDRINRWRSSTDTIIKLRIASKELSNQLKSWQEDLGKVKNNEDCSTPKGFEDALVTFVRVYFGLKPAAPVVLKKNRY
jgi:hypothetical protein